KSGKVALQTLGARGAESLVDGADVRMPVSGDRAVLALSAMLATEGVGRPVAGMDTPPAWSTAVTDARGRLGASRRWQGWLVGACCVLLLFVISLWLARRNS